MNQATSPSVQAERTSDELCRGLWYPVPLVITYLLQRKSRFNFQMGAHNRAHPV